VVFATVIESLSRENGGDEMRSIRRLVLGKESATTPQLRSPASVCRLVALQLSETTAHQLTARDGVAATNDRIGHASKDNFPEPNLRTALTILMLLFWSGPSG
jgi:hypothetical protein